MLLVFAPGCMDSPGDLPKLDMVVNERGIISYFPEGQGPPAAPGSSVSAFNQQFAPAARRGDDDAYREMLEFRRAREDRMSRELRERQYEQDLHNAALTSRREQDRMAQQERFQRGHDEFNRRLMDRDRAAQDQAARQRRQDEAQARVVQRQLDQQFQQQQLEQLRQSGMLSRQR